MASMPGSDPIAPIGINLAKASAIAATSRRSSRPWTKRGILVASGKLARTIFGISSRLIGPVIAFPMPPRAIKKNELLSRCIAKDPEPSPPMAKNSARTPRRIIKS